MLIDFNLLLSLSLYFAYFDFIWCHVISLAGSLGLDEGAPFFPFHSTSSHFWIHSLWISSRFISLHSICCYLIATAGSLEHHDGPFLRVAPGRLPFHNIYCLDRQAALDNMKQHFKLGQHAGLSASARPGSDQPQIIHSASKLDLLRSIPPSSSDPLDLILRHFMFQIHSGQISFQFVSFHVVPFDVIGRRPGTT